VEQHVHVRENGPILELVLDRPDKHNAIGDVMLAELKRHVTRFVDDPAFRVLLLRAEGALFSAGGDLNSALVPDISHGSPVAFRQWLGRGATSISPLAELIAATEKLTVVAHQGPCMGGALELSLAFDFRIASTAASYALPETRFGAVPSAGGVARLTRIVGPHWARWLLVAGEAIDAAKAESIGLLHALHTPEALKGAADELCTRLGAMPPEATGAAKLAIELADELGTQGARSMERILASSLVFGSEYQDEIARLVARLNRKKS
jgi:enoyl-CoA hydratase/carnithine racemase